MDTLEKNLRQFFPRCLKICGQFGDWILPDHFRQILKVGKFSILPKILHSGKILWALLEILFCVTLSGR
jgi:hypothetical protein